MNWEVKVWDHNWIRGTDTRAQGWGRQKRESSSQHPTLTERNWGEGRHWRQNRVPRRGKASG